MVDKQRNYPELPALRIQLPNGKCEMLIPTRSSNANADITLILNLGLDGDQIELGYYLIPKELHAQIPPESGLAQLYAQRVLGRITLDAVMKGTDLWYVCGTFRFPHETPYVLIAPKESWTSMAVGQVRSDLVAVTLDGEKVALSNEP